jgi:integrase/recombinase XerD
MSTPASDEFSSFLKELLPGFMNFKAKLGCTSYLRTGTSWTQARDLDYFLSFHNYGSIEQLNEDHLQRWIHCFPKQAANTKNLKIRFARGLFHYLIHLGLAKHNAAQRISYLKEPRPKRYIYTLKEIKDILQATQSLKRQHPNRLLGWTMETMVLLYYGCGLRLMEALNLKIKDVAFNENTLALWNTKFHKERLVPLSTPMTQHLKSYLKFRLKRHPTSDVSAPFFRLTHSKRPHRSVIQYHFRRLLVRCRLAKPRGRGPRLHDLRHAFAVHRLYKWYQEGHHPLNKLPLLSTYMGHRTVQSTQVYLTITNALLREGDRRFQASFEDAVQKPSRRAFKQR